MSRFCLDRDRFFGLPLRAKHISKKSSPSGCPCLPHVFTKLAEGALSLILGSSTISMTYSLARSGVRAQASGASAPQPSGSSGQLREE